ncbi:MAG TPA: Rap1a/Tai family immunity protein [Edaphobacter sp.]
MRPWIFVGLVLAVMAILVPSAQAFTTTEDLIKNCKVAKSLNDPTSRDTNKSTGGVADTFSTTYCNVFFYAFTQGMFKQAASGKPRSQLRMCLPPNSSSEWPLVFLKFMDNHPNRLHEDAADTVWDALVDAYPCKPPKK